MHTCTYPPGMCCRNAALPMSLYYYLAVRRRSVGQKVLTHTSVAGTKWKWYSIERRTTTMIEPNAQYFSWNILCYMVHQKRLDKVAFQRFFWWNQRFHSVDTAPTLAIERIIFRLKSTSFHRKNTPYTLAMEIMAHRLQLSPKNISRIIRSHRELAEYGE